MKQQFDSIVLVPFALIVGVAIGMQLVSGQFPGEMVGQLIGVTMAAWLAILILNAVINFFLKVAAYADEPELEADAPAPGEVVVLLQRDGVTIGQVRAWDDIRKTNKRSIGWAVEIRRLLSRLSGKPVERVR